MEKKRSPRSSPGILPKSPLVYEKYKSGCARRLIGMLGFRQGRSGKRLVSDKPKEHRDSSGNAYSRSQLDLLRRLHGKNHCTNRIVEEETSLKPKTKRRPAFTSEAQHEKSDSKSAGELPNREIRNKDLNKETCESAVHGQAKVAVLRQKQSSLSAIEKSGKMMNKDNQMGHENGLHRRCKVLDLDLDRHQDINLQVSVNKAAEVLISQNPRDGSKSFLDALDVLSSNKELFITLLQDPNSLSAKRIQDFQGSQLENSRAKSSSKVQMSGTQTKKPGESEELDRIVLLKPRLTSPDEDSVYLRFKRMAKKLKLMVGSNKDDDRANTVLRTILSSEVSGGARETEITQRTGDDTKRMKKTSDETDSQPRIASTSTTAHGRSSDVPVFKRKKRVESDIFKLNTDGEILPRRFMVEKHERINLSPVYDNLHAPSRFDMEREHQGSVSDRTRYYSSYGYYPRFEERNWGLPGLEHEKQSYRFCSPTKNTELFNPKPGYHFKSSNALIQHVLNFPDEGCCTGSEKTEESCSSTAYRNLRTCVEDECRKERHSESSCLDPWVEKYSTILQTNVLFPDGLSAESAETCTSDPILEQEQPSPVSVLERIHMEDDTILPGSIEAPSTAEQIGVSSDHDNYLRNVFEQQPIHEFVKKVLEASALNWTDLFKCTISSEPSLLHEFSHDDHHQRLVLDYTNEILHQMYQRHIKSRPFLLLRSDLVQEAMKCIDWSLLGDPVPPTTLDELMEKELAKPGLWMDFGCEMEDLAADIAERVLEEVVMEIATELVTIQKRVNEFTHVLY